MENLSDVMFKHIVIENTYDTMFKNVQLMLPEAILFIISSFHTALQMKENAEVVVE